MTTPEKLRTLVAERVMGCEKKIIQNEEGYDEEWWVFPERHSDDGLSEGRLRSQWLPDFDARDTWRVMERMESLGWDIDMVCLGANTIFPNYEVHFTRTDAKGFRESTVGCADDPDPKMAISLAALRAVGVEVE